MQKAQDPVFLSFVGDAADRSTMRCIQGKKKDWRLHNQLDILGNGKNFAPSQLHKLIVVFPTGSNSFTVPQDGFLRAGAHVGHRGPDASRPTCASRTYLCGNLKKNRKKHGDVRCERIIPVVPQESGCMKTISLISARLINTLPRV